MPYKIPVFQFDIEKPGANLRGECYAQVIFSLLLYDQQTIQFIAKEVHFGFIDLYLVIFSQGSQGFYLFPASEFFIVQGSIPGATALK